MRLLAADAEMQFCLRETNLGSGRIKSNKEFLKKPWKKIRKLSLNSGIGIRHLLYNSNFVIDISDFQQKYVIVKSLRRSGWILNIKLKSKLSPIQLTKVYVWYNTFWFYRQKWCHIPQWKMDRKKVKLFLVKKKVTTPEQQFRCIIFGFFFAFKMAMAIAFLCENAVEAIQFFFIIILSLDGIYSIFTKKHNSHDHLKCIKSIKLLLEVVV